MEYCSIPVLRLEDILSSARLNHLESSTGNRRLVLPFLWLRLSSISHESHNGAWTSLSMLSSCGCFSLRFERQEKGQAQKYSPIFQACFKDISFYNWATYMILSATKHTNGKKSNVSLSFRGGGTKSYRVVANTVVFPLEKNYLRKTWLTFFLSRFTSSQHTWYILLKIRSIPVVCLYCCTSYTASDFVFVICGLYFMH